MGGPAHTRHIKRLTRTRRVSGARITSDICSQVASLRVPNDEFANFRKSGCGAASSWQHPPELTGAENLLNFRISISLLRFISGEIQLASGQ